MLVLGKLLYVGLSSRTTVEGVRPVGCTIHQRVMRGAQLLIEAEVKAAFLSPQGRPKRQPAAWIAAFERLLKE